MERDRAIALLDRLHSAQNEFYSGGRPELLREMLTQDITWAVPGRNSIAGEYRGMDAVFEYFRRRRDLAGGTFQITQRDVLVGQGDRIAALTDGTATVSGKDHRWSTVGLYATRHDQIAGCWLLPLSQPDFDAIWTD